jgi:hypothetical protein
MGDAVFTAGDLIELHCDVLIIWCDQIGITEETIARSIASHNYGGSNRKMTIPLLLKSSKYIEFQIDDGHLLKVRQTKEGDFVSDLAPSDIGLFIVSDGKEFLSTWLDGGREYSKGQITSEYNFLPFLEYLDSKGWVLNEVVASESDGLGVNTQEELVQALRKLEK